jgi:glycosyltransferase involved in cell wall biosynthesis
MITFTIPFYSNTGYLRRVLDSVRAQTVRDFQCLVVDDCGPEPEAAELVRSYGDERISYRRNSQNRGLAGNWNVCLDAAQTDLVQIVHADDELCPNYAERMLAASRQWPEATAFFCRAQIINAQSQPVFSLPDYVKKYLAPAADVPFVLAGDEGLRSLLEGWFIFCPTLCFRRSQLGERRFDPRWRFVIDLAFVSRLLLEGGQLVGLPDIAYRYRRHSGSQTTELSANLVRFEEERDLYQQLHGQTQEQGWRRAAEAARRRKLVKRYLAYCIAQDAVHGRFLASAAKFKLLRQL